MWLLIIEVIAAIIASVRGWGAKPIILLGGTILFGVFIGAIVGTSGMGLMQLVDIIVVIILVIMAITGKKRFSYITPSVNVSNENSGRVKCPRCAELIMPDAKVCRFCGYELLQKETTVHS